jgi:hypothetical protein
MVPIKPKAEPPQPIGTLVSPAILEHQISNLRKVIKEDKSKIKIIDDFYRDEPVKPNTAICETNNVSVVFYDIQKQLFTKINYDTDLLNSVLTDLCVKFQWADKKSQIKILTDNNKPLDSFKNDPLFPEGPFIIKNNNNIYEAYEKKITNRTIEGRFYNSYVTITEIIHVGKYGILLI